MIYAFQFVDNLVLYNLDELVEFNECHLDDVTVTRPQPGFALKLINCILRIDILEQLYPYIVEFANCEILLEDNTTVRAHCLPYKTKDLSPYTTFVFSDSVRVGCQHFTKSEWAAMPLWFFNSMDVNGQTMAEQYRDFLLSQCNA